MVSDLPPEKKYARQFSNTSKWTILAPTVIVRMAVSVQKFLRFNKPLNKVSAIGGQDHYHECPRWRNIL